MNRKKWLIFILLPVLLIIFMSQPALAVAVNNGLLGYGSRGPAVSELQKELHQAGYYPEGIISGYFGSLTLNAVTRLEMKNKLPVDGKVGWAEWSVLNNSYATKRTSTKLSRMVLGFYCVDYPGDRRSYDSLQANSQLIDQVATFDYQISGNGNIIGDISPEALKLAKSRGVKTIMLVHNISGSIDGFSAYSAISNLANRNRLIGGIVTNLKKYGFDGVNIDLEGIPAQGRQSYTTFLQELGKIIQPEKKLLTVAIPAKTYDDPSDQWSGAYDFKAIGSIADYVVIMSYDEHWFGGDPGPVASLPWVTTVMDYAVQTIPRSKILMGIGCFGYDWPAAGQGKAVTWQAMNDLINRYGNVQWDNYSSVPHLVYWKDGSKHDVWYENSSSLAIKLNLVNNYNLGGIAFWRLGFEDQSFWETVYNKLK